MKTYCNECSTFPACSPTIEPTDVTNLPKKS